ncbi:MAG TPA: TlpA disulfide reductase family protein [Planctomycetota bacterium]|jgi:thiol-disulfide isomerase/thioredoxin|nr:TlpA disulfide reductase family protein [Planctomycetota bacterium]
MFARTVLATAAVVLTTGAAFSQKPADAAAKKPSLVAGSPAPALVIDKWVKGSPVPSFEKGKVYVVEFWATWCGPCIAGMPHLSALQRKYKDKGVTFIGVSAKDKNNSLAAVEAMVKNKGDGMDYTVAWDPERTTFDAYMKAAGQNGIPCSFVVDGTGKIVYIGHPMFLDMPMEQIVAGTWDIQKGGAAVAEAQAKTSEIYKALSTDPKAAIALIGEFESKYPAFGDLFGTLKFDALMATGDFPAAYAAGKKLVDDAIAHKDASALNQIAWKIVDPDAKWEKVDLDLAMRAAEQGVAITNEKDGAVLDTLARVWFLKGDIKKAIECETKAVAESTGEMKASLEKTLAEYKAKSPQ